MKRPSTSELDAMERAIELRYPWFAILWPICPHGHRMIQLGWNPEPFVVVVHKPRSFVRCVRCKREADQRARRRKKQ